MASRWRLQRVFDLGVPLGRVRLDAAFRKRGVDLLSRFVQSEFDHRQIRGRRFQKVEQSEFPQPQFDLVELIEAVAEMDEHQVAFMAQKRKQSAPACAPGFHLGEDTGSLIHHAVAVGLQASAASRPNEGASFDAARSILRS